MNDKTYVEYQELNKMITDTEDFDKKMKIVEAQVNFEINKVKQRHFKKIENLHYQISYSKREKEDSQQQNKIAAYQNRTNINMNATVTKALNRGIKFAYEQELPKTVHIIPQIENIVQKLQMKVQEDSRMKIYRTIMAIEKKKTDTKEKHIKPNKI